GFPGLILAAASDSSFILCESRRKRSSFLQVAAANMELRNVSIESTRIDVGNIPNRCAALTARAIGEPAGFYELAAAALDLGGIAILYVTPFQRLSLRAAHQHGLGEYSRFQYRLRRGGNFVERVLAVWRKLRESPP